MLYVITYLASVLSFDVGSSYVWTALEEFQGLSNSSQQWFNKVWDRHNGDETPSRQASHMCLSDRGSLVQGPAGRPQTALSQLWWHGSSHIPVKLWGTEFI